ncbi:MAG: PIG-L deacetylase family protein [Nocardioidaceae bacterium]
MLTWDPPADQAVTPPSRHTAAWTALLDGHPTAPPPVAPGADLLVLLAHPDDETLAMGASLAAAAAAGVRVRLVTLTRGAAALDHLGITVAGLADRREAELRAAADVLGVHELHCLDLPDGGLAALGDGAWSLLAPVLEGLPADRVWSTWRGDPHPDHRAAARLADRWAADRGLPLDELALWAPHWLDPETLPATARPVRVGTTEQARETRDRALACYSSQLQPLAPGLGPVLPADMLAWGHEVLVR